MHPVSPPPNGSPVQIAAFDFDGTLIRDDSLHVFLLRSLGWAGLARALILSAPWLVAYALRLMSNHRAKARLLHVSLAGRQLADIGRLADDFVQHDLPALWHPWTLRQLTQHQQLGHRCVIVSASPGIYLHAVAAHLQVDAVLCTEMEWQGDALTGRLTTPNCHGLEKVRRLQAWLDATLGPDAKTVLHAYGDTQGDKPMLRLADHAWYRGKTWFPP